LQSMPQWLRDDIKNGNFAVGGDKVAANYQAWHEFIGKINKNKDAELTIQTFYIDESKDVLDNTRYQKVDRYSLSVADNQAVWQYLADDNSNVKGKFSLAYDDETGLHEVFVGDEKVFEFIYFPYDPKQIALYFGYTPLEELPPGYMKEAAIRDGCLVIEKGVIQNFDVIEKFTDSFGKGAGLFIRIFFENDDGITIMDLGSYNERACVTVDYSRCSNRNDLEDIYVTTYYDNCVVSFGGEENALILGFDDFEPIFIFKDVTVKEY